MLIDTHCHLASACYQDLIALREQSRMLHVSHCISQGTRPDDWKPTLHLAAQMPDFISPCLAVHPSDCVSVTHEDLQQLELLCRSCSPAAIGETGLDYYQDPPAGYPEAKYHARQRDFLERHFDLAQRLGLNISLHTRDKAGGSTRCFDDAFAIARNFPKVRPVFHCFIGSPDLAERIFAELDGYISFTGIVTFKKTETVQATVACCPEDRFMLETDSPFLSPEPLRGRTNIPGYVSYIAEKTATLRNTTPDRIAQLTTANALRFFRLPGALSSPANAL